MVTPLAGTAGSLTNPLRGATGAVTAETGRIREHPYVRVGPSPGESGGEAGSPPVDGRGTPPPREGGNGERGHRPLVLVPGLNDPLLTVGDSRAFARAMAVYCRRFVPAGGARRPVYLVSRPHGLDPDATTRGMAAGYARVLADLPRGVADVAGISMGGFLATHLAADHPGRVGRLVLVLSADRLGERGRRTIREWIGHAAAGDWPGLYLAAADLLARGLVRRAMRAGFLAYAALRDPPEGGPADFLASARACLAHDAADRLPAVDAPTLVVGGDRDSMFPAERYRGTARAVPDGRLALLRGVGHEAVIEHGPTVEREVRRFLCGDRPAGG